MISDEERQTIISLAEKFRVKELFLFGSSIENDSHANDIDLAVRGISSEDFFDFHGKLLRYLAKPVDVVNLAKPSRFTKLIEKNGLKIYERPV